MLYSVIEVKQKVDRMNHNMLSNNLKKLRVEKNYTQEQVAEHLGVSAKSVSRWECNNTMPDVMLLPEIAKLYCVTIDDLYKENITAYPNYAQRLLSVYESTGKTEDFLRAEAEFEKLFRTDEYTMDDIRCCGIMYHFMMRECKKKALDNFDKVIEIGKSEDEDTYYRTWQQKMSLFAEIGKSEKNIEIQLEHLQHEPNNPRQWVLVVTAYYYAGQMKNAYEYVQKALVKFDDVAELYIWAGDICKKLKKYDEAFQNWSRALELDDTYLDARYSMGFCYEETGEYKNAYENWLLLAKELEKRGFQYEKELPLQLAEKCLEKFQ